MIASIHRIAIPSPSRMHGTPPRRGRLALLVAGPALALVLAGCGQSTSTPAYKTPSPTSTSATKASSITVKTATVTVNGKSETVFTNSSGRTLYYFTKDTPTQIACAGTCAGIWPPLTTSATSVNAPSGVSGSFTVYKGANGNQVEYNGHALFIYSLDTGPDQSHGEGVLGEWFVATPGLAAATPGTASPSPSSSSSGYSY
ncbi:MAG: COG4315 family predicted lipoprotein [Candidatus Dormibacteria bacterium]